MDPTSLTREQLLELLAKKDREEAENSAPPHVATNQCIYIPIRGSNRMPCTAEATTPYRFCKKHQRTVQAQNARKEWEQSQIQTQSQSQSQTQQPSLPTPSQIEETVRKTHPTPVVKKKVIRRNRFGRFEDPSTHIVFDPNTKAAFGYQDPGGTVYQLTPELVEVCKKNKWRYHEPDYEEESSEEEGLSIEEESSGGEESRSSESEGEDSEEEDAVDEESVNESEGDDEEGDEEELSSNYDTDGTEDGDDDDDSDEEDMEDYYEESDEY